MNLFINEFYVTSSSDLIVSVQLNSTTNKYGISNLTNIDIGLASISLKLRWNWLLAIDINNDPNLLTNMACYNNLLYIVGEASFKWIYLLTFDSITKTASNLISYSINSSNLTYQLFKFEIVDFSDPFMLSTLWYGDVVNYAILSKHSSNIILSWSLLALNIPNAFILYSKFVNSTQIIIYNEKMTLWMGILIQFI